MFQPMRIVRFVAPVVLVAGLSGCGGGGTAMLDTSMMPPDTPPLDETAQPYDLSSHLTQLVEQGRSPGLLAAIVDQDGVRAIGAAGVRREGSPELLTTDDLVRINSNTKAMTATMLATMVEDGTFPNGWQTTIAEVFPELVGEIHQDYNSVDLFSLIRMTSGVNLCCEQI